MKATRILLLAALSSFFTANLAFAQTWTQTSAITTNWQWVASSADGSKLVALFYTNGIYASTNSGVTWQKATNGPMLTGGTGGQWVSIASSADGTKLVAAAFYLPVGPGNGGIFVSTNSGLGWTQTSDLSQLNAVACSADGTKMAAVVSGGGIYVSTNSGMTWAQTSVQSQNWQSIASSADGSRLVAGVAGGGVYVSTNSGGNWSQASPLVKDWLIVCSADATKLAAVDYGVGIYTSTNSGATWASNNLPSAVWRGITTSADGTRLAAIATNGFIYTTTNSGASWRSNSVPTNYWWAIKSSADGTKLVATVHARAGSVYTSYSPPAPRLALANANNSLAFSWMVPTTNFVLQRISDLTKTGWVTMTNAPVLNLTNLQNQVSLPPPGSNSFFRLKTP